VQLILGYTGFHQWDLGDLMPLGLRVVPLQRVMTAWTWRGFDRDHDGGVRDRHQGPCLASVSRLPAGLTATGLAARMLVARLGGSLDEGRDEGGESCYSCSRKR
jgi:hypothetical protein